MKSREIIIFLARNLSLRAHVPVRSASAPLFHENKKWKLKYIPSLSWFQAFYLYTGLIHPKRQPLKQNQSKSAQFITVKTFKNKCQSSRNKLTCSIYSLLSVIFLALNTRYSLRDPAVVENHSRPCLITQMINFFM